MLWSKRRIGVSQAEADSCVRRYCTRYITDCNAECPVDEREFPFEFLATTDIFKDYISHNFCVSVTYDQFVRALRKLKPRRCFVNKYNQHIIIGYRLGETIPVAEAAAEQSTVV